LTALIAAPGAAAAGKDVPYVPTPPEVVDRMLKVAEVKSGDVVYDLGCGDGRIVIAAVKIEGVKGVCVEIDPELVAQSRRNAEEAGVADRIRFVEGNIFEVPIKDATVVALYLLPQVNMQLRPRLLKELRPGTRIVSHAFDMGDWTPEERIVVELPPSQYTIYRWVIPASRTTTK
jgi:SAM-dependent methyltransferase